MNQRVRRADADSTASRGWAARGSAVAGARAGVVILAASAGVLFAYQPLWAVGAVAGASFVVIAFRRLVWGVALWIPSFFVAGDAPGKALLMAGFVVCSLVWMVDALAHRREVLARLSQFRQVVFAVLALVVWLAATLAWARDAAAGLDEAWRWLLAFEMLLMIMTGLTGSADILVILAGWVAGAVVAAISALLTFHVGDIVQADAADTLNNRLAGGAGDPNYLASRLIAGMILALGLLRVLRSPWARGLLLLALPLLGAATAGTGSRGGLLAIFLTGAVALVLFRRNARLLLLPVLGIVASAGLWFLLFPQFWSRVLVFDDGGSGRSDLWRAAVRLAVDSPVAGIGLGNFPNREPALALDIGPVLDARAIAEDRRVVHNTYLQLWTETGVVGLVLFLAVLGACMWCCLRAATLYDRMSESRGADLSRVVVLALVSFMGSASFISMGRAYEFWALFALGPVLLSVARARFKSQAIRSDDENAAYRRGVVRRDPTF